MFTPIKTERLVIRSLASEDATGLFERRNEPEVAEYQNWSLPYPLEKAEKVVADVIAMGGPQDDEWWNAAVCDPDSGAVLGDLALHLTQEGRTAEVGYTFARDHWGKGYASEALGALVDFLFEELGVTRVFGMLHPDNLASAMVMERNGFLFEGHTRQSFWLDDEVSDDWIYGLLRPDWEQWKNRPSGLPQRLELIEVTTENYREVAKLQTHKSQERFVAPMLWSLANASFPEEDNGAPVVPWMRAIVADGEIVGFVMIALTTEHHPEPYLWRLLIDRLHQRRGIGGRALDLVENEVLAMGDSTLLVSWVEGKGSSGPMYLRRGFEPTGEVHDGEIVGRKKLA